MKNVQDELSTVERFTAPTPRFFRILQVLGIVFATISGALIQLQLQGIDLPDFLSVIADKASVIAGIVAALVSQFTVDFKKAK